MSFSNDPALLVNQLPISVELSENFNLFNEQVTLLYKRIANSTNTKTGGLHDKVERYNSDQYFTATPNLYRNVYRKSFDLIELAGGNIAPGATVTAAHGIVGIVLVVNWYGGVVTDTPDFRPVPYVDTVAVTNQIGVTATAVNIVLVNGATAPTITSGVLTLEYLKV